MNEVFIAGAGIISAIGNNKAECLEALESSKDGIGKINFLSTAHANELPAAEVKLSNAALSELCGLPSEITRTALLSSVAAQEALADASILGFERFRTGFVSANTVGGMDKSENFYAAFLADKQKGRLRNIIHHECGSATEIVADKLNIRNYVTTVSTACSSSANAIFFGARLIKHNILDIVIAGGTDSLTKFTLNGFNTLMILDQKKCKPFDANRKGLNLGEGAGYLVLVSDKLAADLKLNKVCRLSGWCNANDAYHQTASSPDGKGSYMAMSGALKMSGLKASDISYINLHGTGTQNNDIAEGTAVKNLFLNPYPKMSSTKSFTGHTLGASGGIEAVFSVMSLQHGLIYPSLRFEESIPELPFKPETVFFQNQKVQHVLSNSFGFGGNCTSLIFSKF